MSRKPQEESIYTLHRRIGTQRPLPDVQSEPSNAHHAPERNKQPQSRKFTLGGLFSLRIRAA